MDFNYHMCSTDKGLLFTNDPYRICLVGLRIHFWCSSYHFFINILLSNVLILSLPIGAEKKLTHRIRLNEIG